MVGIGLLIPFLGTTLGAALVFFLKDQINPRVQKALLGFASGVMVAASVWSLLIPAMDMSEDMGKFAFVPAAVGLLLGFAFLLLLDEVIPHLHNGATVPEGHQPKKRLNKNTMLVLAVTLHNIPEGMAIGVVYAAAIYGHSQMSMAGALALSIGIAIQNFPEGAIISMPLRSDNKMSKGKAFLYGAGSGAVEPVAAVITILLTSIITPILPYLLAFAAGAMLYVVVEELIPEASLGEHSNIGTIGFAVGFAIMMILDIALG
ncbi:ZIP family zinc transporter [Lachnospiraceae bacterium PF1-21]|uniref:ZIP family metal transporter n=1 Tax=Ohessyouella blattaphilus TaxID=2949333 RepID=A0ABT1EKJ0_9FIRM|nr:ZIP family metal transporter [Ohessyouella blattaphilus]MCP1111004.1 ZIP family metal transporter [Ohessyouella blattaphilus]MCR8564398.1 ZIP family metal transporter [Ohessyouella blattaphilus]MDL2249785.1 ZIP family metal transporter [Lachnospiraceae bacterium OttesenSCG-928-J05]